MKKLDQFLDALESRHSCYQLGSKDISSDMEIEQAISRILDCAPTAFNSQGGRIVILYGVHHKKLWKIVEEELKKIVPADKLVNTVGKLEMFGKSRGTILFFEDEITLHNLEEKFPLYKENFLPWAYTSNGMLQLMVWTALSQMGLGANLQHYNPVIDTAVKENFGINTNWKLLAQMPFGNKIVNGVKKEGIPAQKRMRIFK